MSAKENSGASARRRKQRRLTVWLIGLLVLYISVSTIYQAHFAGMFIPDIETDPLTGKSRVRRRPGRQRKRLNPEEMTDSEDGILEGALTLVDIQIPSNGLVSSGDDYVARADFCIIDWKAQQKDPSIVPMFRDLRKKSKLCDGTLVNVDLQDIVEKARSFDAKFKDAEDGTIALGPKGVVFHETRCGSTLVANMLASLSKTSRVFSESPPPVTALRACDRYPCNPSLHTTLIQDVFYMMGRSAKKDHQEHVFYKFQSISSMVIDKFTEAFPTTPWMFLYRDTVEVMQSHWKERTDYEAGNAPVCAKNYRAVAQPRTTLQLLESKHKSVGDVSRLAYCAAHLGGLSLSAVQEHERTDRGSFVNYNQLPAVIWDKILPDKFGVQVSSEMQSEMSQVASQYSKGRGNKAGTWQEDTTRKQSTAPTVMVEVANFYVGDVYKRMEALTQGG